MARPLAAQVGFRDLVKFALHHPRHALEGTPVTVRPLLEQLGDFAFAVLGHSTDDTRRGCQVPGSATADW